MEKLLDHRIFILLFMLLVWAQRAKRALQTVTKVPAIKPGKDTPPNPAEKVSVIIPAKNEEKNIRECLERLLSQDYPNFEVIVADDRSTDRTAKILESFGGKIRVVAVPPTPDGWTGKNFAIHSALPAATGSWYLFTDADTRHERFSVSASLAHAAARDYDFLTLLPRCIAETFVEKLIQPTAMGFMGLWFPIDKVNQPRSKMVFGNGQYLLIRKSLYQKMGGHAAVREEFLEDFALVGKAKKMGARVQCAFGVPVYGTRMYDSFAGIWRGWRRIYLHACQRNAFKLALHAFSALFFSVVPFLTFIQIALLAYVGHSAKSAFLVATHACLLVIILGIAWKTYGMVKANRLFALLHPVAAFFLGMILFDATLMAATKQKTVWR